MLSQIVDIVMCHKLIKNETASIRQLLKQFYIIVLKMYTQNIIVTIMSK